MNTFGTNFRVTTFGESHGPAMGVVIDGCPAGVEWRESLLLENLERRRPGTRGTVSARRETDIPEILSGVFEGKTLGTPIAMMIRNVDAQSKDYENLAPRTGHADDVWKNKFGHVDPRGGGRSSGRETVTRVLAGSVAQMALKQMAPETKIHGYISKLGPLTLDPKNTEMFQKEMTALLEKAKTEGESFGAEAHIQILNPPKNLGQPVFGKLKTDLTAALMSIGAVNGVEVGEGDVLSRGTEFHGGDQNVYGGIRGGISTGETILLKVNVKPTSSIMDVAKKGRHDPSIAIRAVPVMESMVNLVLLDHLLWTRLDRI